MNDDSLSSFRSNDDSPFEEDMKAEGDIMEAEQKHDKLVSDGYSKGTCKNCLDTTYVKSIKGINLCRMCAKRYPAGMPF
ncbi:hypothetical protein E3T26_06895 [Cryobacterium sp. TMT1-21]|uniref:hypothetical protein n=1 Tax=Cryobacterium sp. TMT1-21 TaxID=1259234 RepID=UPI00106CA34F|nr:hypothetical protein [Cryobacterium sp. TMT1-21]TFD15503.1 hypothetical protein E3T26_06895 [Cryobacterium sp. TMT1-21]